MHLSACAREHLPLGGGARRGVAGGACASGAAQQATAAGRRRQLAGVQRRCECALQRREVLLLQRFHRLCPAGTKQGQEYLLAPRNQICAPHFVKEEDLSPEQGGGQVASCRLLSVMLYNHTYTEK